MKCGIVHRIYRVLLAAAVFGFATAAAATERAASSWSTVAVIPWGSGAGALRQEIDSPDERLAFRGPSRFLVFVGGRFAVLDVLDHAVKEFDSRGRSAAVLPFPAHDKHDAETMAIDMAAGGHADYWLLELGIRGVMHLKEDGKIDSYPLAGLGKYALLTAMTRDAEGSVYVLNGYDSSVRKLGAGGKQTGPWTDEAAQAMTCDARGRFYNLRLAKGQDPHHYELVRWAPGSSPEPIAKVDCAEEIEHADVFGVDAAGNVYASLGTGTVENPSHHFVIRWDSSGKETGRAACPADPIRLHFVHGKAVAPDGTVYGVEVGASGLTVEKLRSF